MSISENRTFRYGQGRFLAILLLKGTEPSIGKSRYRNGLASGDPLPNLSARFGHQFFNCHHIVLEVRKAIKKSN
ncbi:hypothetical protein OSB04_026373 [Centaurea solstitialis]|uniref:Uncharacterized protein n=1 Tax=Centaurea solstitialis TaxID=347529 RepID=A0AA38VYP5_9ASTR|nr:hypothetical protein OSB04_026373 [Centaurea solstitialis]